MKIICASDSFKDALNADKACAAMARGIKRASLEFEVDCCPVADGGEGTVNALIAATDGTICTSLVTGPLGAKRKAKWGLFGGASDKTAVIEMAAASGLELVAQDKRNPVRTSTYGTGELIANALEKSAKRIILAIGGSATNDGGCGAAQALGAKFFDGQNQLIEKPITGGMLGEIADIDLSGMNPKLRNCKVQVACDVTNPLTGENGAAYVYGGQKGATEKQIEDLDSGLENLSRVVRGAFGKDAKDLSGAGAAGGLGYGAVVFLDGKLERGIDIVLRAVGFEKRVADCALCMTGEGKLDGQSLSGKTIFGITRMSGKYDVPVVALVGKFAGAKKDITKYGLKDVVEIGAGLSARESIARTAELLEQAAYSTAQKVMIESK